MLHNTICAGLFNETDEVTVSPVPTLNDEGVDFSLLMIAGVVVALLIILAVMVLLLVCLRRKYLHKARNRHASRLVTMLPYVMHVCSNLTNSCGFG